MVRACSVRRYQVRDEILIRRDVEDVYALATNPATVPAYAPEIARIESVARLSPGAEIVVSHLRVAGLSIRQRYRYRYVRPRRYFGVQERRWPFRGFFGFTFREHPEGTLVSHHEGIMSSVPFLAMLLGVIYFRVLAPGGVREELEGLRRIAED